VFAHPVSGEPLYKAGLLRRMRKALKAAELDESPWLEWPSAIGSTTCATRSGRRWRAMVSTS
jgi:hypothetical protein